MREHVVKFASDSAALGDRGRACLLVARIFELGHQQLGPVLALPRPLEELRHNPQQDRHHHLGRDGRRRAPGDRGDGTERDRYGAGERDTGGEWQPGNRDEHRSAGGHPRSSLELKSGDRDACGSHDRDNCRLHREPDFGEVVADRAQQRHGKQAQRERHREPLAVQSRDGVAVGASEHHHEDHSPPERTQRPSLAMRALLSARPSLRYPLAVGRWA